MLELCHNVRLHADAVARGRMVAQRRLEVLEIAANGARGEDNGGDRFGRIGRSVGRIADAMGMRVIANDTYQGDPPQYEGFRWAPVEEVLRESDVVSLHSPLFPETQGMINARSLALMKPSAFLINTSRGPLVVDQDLADALNAGRLAGAAVDVLRVEPPAETNPLLSARNCLVTPHIAWATREARTRLMDLVISRTFRAF